jgi:O-antigen/teichoic acid export membrane protein
MTYEQTDPASTTGNILSKMSRGLVALVSRQILYYGALFFGNIFLARALAPEIYGIFVAMFAFQTMLTVFTDVGFGAALIQREQSPTQSELASLFSLQLIIYTLIATGLWVGTPWIIRLANIDVAAVPVIRALGIVLLMAVLRAIPAMLLERELRFEVIALAEVLGMLAYQVVVVILVWAGYGLASIVVALAVRYTLDLAIILRHRPWRPRLSLNFTHIFPYLRFSVGIQGVRLMSYIKDQLPLVLLVPVIGAAGAGIWGWSLFYIGIPVYFNRLVDRLVFPLYSRVQHNPEAMGTVAAMAIWLNFSVGLLVLFILVRFADLIVPLIYGAIWLTALPVVYALAPNMIGGFVTGSIFPVLFAAGQIHFAFRLIFIWVVLTVLGVGGGLIVGQLTGMALAYSLATLVICVVLLRRSSFLAPFPFWRTVTGPVVALIVAATVTELFMMIKTTWMFTLPLAAFFYAISLLILSRQMIYAIITSLQYPTRSSRSDSSQVYS